MSAEVIAMVPLEPLFCPCCTPALLHSLAQSNPAMLPRQLMLLGTGALTAVIAHNKLIQTSKNEMTYLKEAAQ